MSRRLMKALEDLYTHYDGSVRNAAGGIVQVSAAPLSLLVWEAAGSEAGVLPPPTHPPTHTHHHPQPGK